MAEKIAGVRRAAGRTGQSCNFFKQAWRYKGKGIRHCIDQAHADESQKKTGKAELLLAFIRLFEKKPHGSFASFVAPNAMITVKNKRLNNTANYRENQPDLV